MLERQLLEINALENSAEYERMLNRVKVVKAKISLAGGN
jgi:hypothetical protein